MAIPMPGPYQISNTIQEILQRRREEARAAMLDKLEQDRTYAGMEAQKKQLELEGERNALDARRTTSDEAQSAAQVRESTERVNRSKQDSLPFQGARGDSIKDTDLKKYLIERGQMETRQPTGPTEDGGNLPSFEWYKGSPEFQQQEFGKEQAASQVDSLLQDPDFQKKSPTEKFLHAQAMGITLPEWAAQGPRRVVPIPWNQRTPVEVGPNDVPMEMSQPHQTPAWMRPQTYQIFDRNNTLLGTSRPMDYEDQQRYMAENPEHVLRPLGFQPTGSGASGRVAATLVAKLAAAKGQYEALRTTRERERTYLGLGGPPDPSDLELAKMTEAESIRQQLNAVDPAPQDIKELAADAIAGGATTVEEVIAGLPPEDVAQLDATDRAHLQRLMSR